MDEIQCESVVPEETMRVPSRIREPTGRDRARQVMLGMTTALAVVAVCMVLAGVSGFCQMLGILETICNAQLLDQNQTSEFSNSCSFK
jgi:hypothetical protein